ncbi:acetyl-CoA C-acetyltransferase [Novosphingobium pentaromativorans]|uniref:Acetyl-CoA acetyltransferase n=1 Tax=Novosphingobium pentaromativorans US6-1 TaxID=1088721 RepID=G6E810_9SPHN|nr:acetyl-CoA C-acetyltransferase [Novosphingobium pentaromativorans]AIT81476.1 acetyl-CoA acetyltransferase [Novosphingobium pentaromativorans US6-1]EHJ62653.1 acetyl-CoA acetyltransferase [Novosphingobium pentaromativorans US6-1]
MAEAYIVDAVRSAGGRRNGALSHVHPADLAGDVLSALVARTGIDPTSVEDVVLGCVTQVGEQSFAFARNAVLASTLPETVPAVTVDRQCGSSQQAVQFAAQAVMSGTQDVVIAAGAESMSRVPMLSNQQGVGTGPISDRIRKRFGVEGFSQFEGAEMMARKYGYSRETLDRFALHSHELAAKAIALGAFDEEIVPITVETPDGTLQHSVDEGVRADSSLEKLGALKTLTEGGVITAGNASQICDGASAVLVVSERALKAHGLVPLARIHAMTVTGGDPVIMLEEPIAATQKLLERAGMAIGDIDLYEVNEAFAPVPLAWLEVLGGDAERLNVHGGSIALGHPLGSSGTKLMATLVHALRRHGKRYGLQTMCEAGGIANAMIVEAL